MVRLAPWVLVGHHGWRGGVGLYPPMQNGPQKSPGGPVVGTHGGLWWPTVGCDAGLTQPWAERNPPLGGEQPRSSPPQLNCDPVPFPL